MKKLMLIGCFAIINVVVGCKGSKREAPAVPESVLTAFKAKYPDVRDVKWEEEQQGDKTIFEAEFKTGGKKAEVKYDDMGNFVEEK